MKVTEEAEKDTSLEDAFRENFKKLSGGEREFVDLWKKFTKSSIDVMQTQLDRLHIRSDFNIGESFYE
ncbi:MAG: hypothetical protein H6767_03005 [Candidatus Peribacteria bacterium]|nr:MAG: hypothetical protein H6767_03005 [Candidatus Peribacteria bacterium]